MMDVEWGSETDTGRVRANNEDSVLVRGAQSFAVLCDGMGGHRAGEVASGLAVESFAAGFTATISRESGPTGGMVGTRSGFQSDPSSTVRHALFEAARAANSAVYAKGQSALDFRGMGCTLVALHLGAGRASFLTVGDSRLYLFREGKLLQISEDHTRLRMLERMGVNLDAIDARRLRGVLTRAVGTHLDLEVDYGECETLDGDLWLLCSDGLTDELDDEAIRSILGSLSDPRSAARTCVQRAVEAGGRDNVSVIVARVARGPEAAGSADLPKIETMRLGAEPEESR